MMNKNSWLFRLCMALLAGILLPTVVYLIYNHFWGMGPVVFITSGVAGLLSAFLVLLINEYATEKPGIKPFLVYSGVMYLVLLIIAISLLVIYNLPLPLITEILYSAFFGACAGIAFTFITPKKSHRKKRETTILNDKKENSRWNYLAVCISILSLIATGFTAYTAFKANEISGNSLTISQNSFNAIEPFQKPIINLENSNFQCVIEKFPYYIQLDYSIDLLIKNYGNGIAENTTITFYARMLENPGNLTLIESYTTANEIYPNTDKSVSLCCFSYLDSNIVENKTCIAFIIRMQCKDKVTGNLENQTYWLKHLVGTNLLLDLSIQEKNNFLQYEKNKFLGS